ncbi:acetyl-CoA C-acetyltransferase [Brachybacterium alimentarium]|uniref:acetyl-CoA C-acyltransferase n=1 Tax=Brachybacterium alimentarium TaxID=47845 RepID=A0A2A3YJB0_9MICO|nr:acetyl-CoA C-acetyltransferase [Brachybacterium alimentarium]PCC33610.1 acetyl-CoA acetyltransferase [Brachybacterium alimentarium]PCC39387.1 acetyl-CoA acetyltransferase [Brachybacterium alimentarium]RCS74554.1 acetyl-CoA C-acetyltransferase [Brachybacterium alimentarium]RCS75298.1 acetyl-CoA C-acetyltransferase [Brachybacterium alimentarium]RCS79347.1 acetyl-CoA C-acetyltransferase [Brachybacterium alimentarium]
MPEAVIVATARSPIGRARKGSLKDVRPDDLAAQMIRAALDQVPELDPSTIDDLQLGCAIPEGYQGGNLARTVAIRLGLDSVPGATVTRFCASSIQTTRAAFHAIASGEARAVISAGVESISLSSGKLMEEDARDPQFREAWERTDKRASREIPAPWHDPRQDGELPDAYIQMGQTAENVAELRGISRAAQDEYAVRSQNRAEAAKASGFFDRDITPVTLPDGTVISADDSPRAGVTLDAAAGLDPVFRPDGTVTAGNCCPLNDGAAALVIMEAEYAKELGITPLARVVATGVSGLSPEIMGLGPVEATRRALALADLTIDDIDLVELNEAFAAQVIPSAEDLGIDHDKLNVHGGAIALGHPWGSTGARLTTTLLNGLREREGRFGLATLCVGGGQGMALIIERMS